MDDWEVLERIWIRDNTPPGGVFLDIGANSGVYSISLAKHFEMVYAIEPDKTNARVLLENARLNGVSNIIILRMAAWSKCQMLTYQQVLENDTSSGAVAWDGPNPYLPAIKTVEVRATTVDALGLNPSVVKIDVEGGEQHVLLGMVHTIVRCRPVICVEVHEERYMEFTKMFLELLGYELKNPQHFKRLRLLVFEWKTEV